MHHFGVDSLIFETELLKFTAFQGKTKHFINTLYFLPTFIPFLLILFQVFCERDKMIIQTNMELDFKFFLFDFPNLRKQIL